MKKNPILESLSSRKLRFGGYATLLIVGGARRGDRRQRARRPDPREAGPHEEQDLLAVRRRPTSSWTR